MPVTSRLSCVSSEPVAVIELLAGGAADRAVTGESLRRAVSGLRFPQRQVSRLGLATMCSVVTVRFHILKSDTPFSCLIQLEPRDLKPGERQRVSRIRAGQGIRTYGRRARESLK